MTTAIQRLIRTETKLFLREPLSLIFVLAFPALVVLVLAGSFDHNDPGFGGATPSDYYISAYISVVLAAMGFIMLPVHLAAYRERGVLRRFQASHLPPWALPAAWVAVAAALSTAGIVVLLAAAQLSFGVPGIDHLGATLAAVLLAVLTYISIGILLGMLLPTASRRPRGGAGPVLRVVPARRWRTSPRRHARRHAPRLRPPAHDPGFPGHPTLVALHRLGRRRAPPGARRRLRRRHRRLALPGEPHRHHLNHRATG